MKKYPVILQHNEEDCGAACLATVSHAYGKIFSIKRTREAAGTGQLGTTLLNLKQGAQTLGFNARGVRVPLELVDKKLIPLPGIIHWKGNHWVVLYGRRGQKYVVADPAFGLRYLSPEEINSHWMNNVMLLLETRPDFHQLLDDRHKVSGYRRLLQRLWHHRSLIGRSLLFNLTIGCLSLTTPFLLQVLTDDVLVRGDTHLLRVIIKAVLVMHIMSSGLNLAQSHLVTYLAQRLELDLMLEFGRAILSLPLSYYETHRSGEVSSRLLDIREVNQLISPVGLILPSQLLIAVASVTFMVIYSRVLTLVALGIAALIALGMVCFLSYLQQKNRTLLAFAAETQGILVETFKGALALKTIHAAPQLWAEFQGRYGRQSNLTFRVMNAVIIIQVFSGFLALTGETLLLWFGSLLVINQQLSIGQLLGFNALNLNLILLMTSLVSFVPQVTRTQAATERLMDVIEAQSEPNEEIKPTAKLAADAPVICQNLTFHHPGRVELLKDFSLTIPGGKAIAIIGKSGCGKSTLAKLIAGLYEPESGTIRIEPYNLTDLSLDCVRQQVVLVPQDAHFWSRSILDNFHLGSQTVSFEQIVTACQIAQADEFISKLPNKYHTILGEFAMNLSGGQRQRLAIARGIVTDPPLLILDESTAGLDPVSEGEVLDRLLASRHQKTTILISHRPRVIERADWIIWLDEGRIKLQGTPGDILAQSGDRCDFLIP